MMPRLRRREMLRVLAGAAVTSLGAGAAMACGDDSDAPSSTATPNASTPTGGSTPASGSTPAAGTRTTISSKDGILDTTLLLEGKMVGSGASERWAITVNGETPGPTLHVRPGDRMKIVVDNRLMHPTNIHTHGLRVSPSGNADNPFIEIPAGTKFSYEIDIPDNHPGGHFWYHPHLHHHVAEQLGAGFFGAIIVSDEADSALSGLTDRLLMLQDSALPKTEAAAFSVSNMAQMEGRESPTVLVSGLIQPTLQAKAGEWERWRLLNASPSRFYKLRVDGAKLAVIGTDGGRLAEPRTVESVSMVPGERVELLVQFSQAGQAVLRTEAVARGGVGMGAGGGITSPAGNLVTFQVEGAGAAAATPAIPGTLSLERVATTGTREVVFSMGGGGGGQGMQFLIDGKQFEANRVDVRVKLGDIEEWTVRNTSPMDHPFHLHIWPFQVVAQSPGTPQVGWKDVVNVPANGWVRLHIPFTEVAGRTVFHCHILDHEDRGMMAIIEAT